LTDASKVRIIADISVIVCGQVQYGNFSRQWEIEMTDALDSLDLSRLQNQVSAFSEFFASLPSNPVQAMHGTIAQMHALCCELGTVASVLWKSPEVQRTLRPAIDLQTCSPFVRRLRDWPRGYPGDYETVELLVKGSRVPTGRDAGEWIDWYALNTAIGQQHRNKVWWQHLQMCAVTPGRILSIGCGGGADFNIAPNRFSGCQVVLLDMDREALRLATRMALLFLPVLACCLTFKMEGRRWKVSTKRD
jgi:extracellular factor (EF) 3-hydroxypalmitic acid methyl ester biosynthesis protein